MIRLIRHDPVVRLDADIEGVHQARVATRRLRSDLRTFRPMLDREWSQGLRDELGWIARILGEVRDGDVLLERLARSVGGLAEPEREAEDAVLATLAKARDEAHADLLATLRSRPVHRPARPARRRGQRAGSGRRGVQPAAEVVPGLVRRPWHKLAKRVAKLGDDPSDARLHEVRIRTKRARYAAEVCAPVVGKPARTFAPGGRPTPGHARRAARRGRRRRLARRLGRAPRLGRGAARSRRPSRQPSASRPTSSARAGGSSGTSWRRRTSAPGCDGGRFAQRADSSTASASDGADEILVVHRPAYDDWSFPKGKLEDDESDEAAALREVEEETGLRCRLARELPTSRYRDARGRPKTVRYWLMTPSGGRLAAANEVDDARFVTLGRGPRAPQLLARRRTARQPRPEAGMTVSGSSHSPCEGEEPARVGRPRPPPAADEAGTTRGRRTRTAAWSGETGASPLEPVPALRADVGAARARGRPAHRDDRLLAEGAGGASRRRSLLLSLAGEGGRSLLHTR